MLINHVMNTEVMFTSPDQSLKSVAAIMEKKDFDVMPVCKNKRLIAKISIRDIAVNVCDKGMLLKGFLVEELMDTKVQYVFDDQSTEFALNFMTENQLSMVFVLDRENNLRGILSKTDIWNDCSDLEELLKQ